MLAAPVTIDATQGGEQFTQMNGSTRFLKPNDMMMTDGKGIVCTIIYGQDKRTPISPKTRRALYVAYAPAGVLYRQCSSSTSFINTSYSSPPKSRLRGLKSSVVGMFSTEFLLTSLIVIVIPGTGVIYTVSMGLFHGRRATVAAAIGCTIGILPHLLASSWDYRSFCTKLPLFSRDQMGGCCLLVLSGLDNVA
ncbi:MAG: hypothetical protein R3C44_24935 [Chloroflexota bacterium]